MGRSLAHLLGGFSDLWGKGFGESRSSLNALFGLITVIPFACKVVGDKGNHPVKTERKRLVAQIIVACLECTACLEDTS